MPKRKKLTAKTALEALLQIHELDGTDAARQIISHIQDLALLDDILQRAVTELAAVRKSQAKSTSKPTRKINRRQKR